MVGGYFDRIAGEPCQSIASYNTATRKWRCISPPFNPESFSPIVRSLYYHPFSDYLYAAVGPGAAFNTSLCIGLCKMKGNQFFPTATFNNYVDSITGNPNSGDVYFCGFFTSMNGFLYSPYVGMFNGTDFLPMPNGFNRACRVIVWDAFQNRVYAGGEFSASFSLSLPGIALWNGTNWIRPVNNSQGYVGAIFAIRSIGFGNFLIGGTTGSVFLYKYKQNKNLRIFSSHFPFVAFQFSIDF